MPDIFTTYIWCLKCDHIMIFKKFFASKRREATYILAGGSSEMVSVPIFKVSLGIADADDDEDDVTAVVVEVEEEAEDIASSFRFLSFFSFLSLSLNLTESSQLNKDKIVPQSNNI